MKEEKDGEVFISRQSRYFMFTDIMNKVLLSICILKWRAKKYFSRQYLSFT